MSAPVPKTKKIELLVKLVQKRCKGIAPPQERPVLEGLIYAALLENAAQSQADEAFAVLENYFVDWNEARVALPQELADIFPMLSEPLQAGERVRNTLQAVFDRTFQFDLEDIPKKSRNLSQAVEFFETLPGCSRFMADVMTQTVLGGHTIPLDEATLRVFRLLGLTQVNNSKTKEFVPGIERAISKKSGITVFYQLHHFAAGFFNNPESAELRQILKTLDAEVLSRSCAKPVLIIPKIQEKPRYIPPIIVKLPAVPAVFASDDDDFDEENTAAVKIPASDDTEDEVFQPKLGTSAPKTKQAEGKSKNTEKNPAKKQKSADKPAKEKSGAKKNESKKSEAKKGVKKESSVKTPKKSEKKQTPPAAKKNGKKPTAPQKNTKKNPVQKPKKK